MKKHGMHGTVVYKAWINLRSRVNCATDKDYPKYGGRGIKVCERWRNFENFYKDMASTHAPGLSLGRIDNNGDYNPENCRWETIQQQNRNKSNGINYLGETAIEAGIRLQGNKTLVHSRVKEGWSLERAFTESVNRKSKNEKN